MALEVFALTGNMKRATGTIDCVSLEWRRKYYGVGSFEMHVRASDYDPSWAYIYAADRPETGIIQKVQYSDTSAGPNGEDTVMLSGLFTEAWLNQYTFLVEQTEQQAYRIYMPRPVELDLPKLYEDSEGNLITETKGYGGVKEYSTVDGEYIDPETVDTSSMTRLDLQPGAGAVRVHYPTPDGMRPTDYYSFENYVQYSEDGKTLISIAPDGTKSEFEIIGKDGSSTIYRDGDGSLKWVAGVARSINETYKRSLESWETMVKVEGLEVVTDMWGNPYARAYRTVKGPWQLRTDLDVNEPADNVQRIIQWAQGIWGSNILYDEVGFEGEEKVIDPSMKLFGDMCYEELKTIGASVRMFYSFENDAVVFDIWRGLDRTQSQTGNPWAVFSDTWGTLHGFEASTDSSNYRNTCYVLYQFRDRTDEDGNPIGPRGYVKARLDDGLPDWETVLDLRGEEPTDANQTNDAFIESLRQRGISHLQENYYVVDSLSTMAYDTGGYLRDYDLGDKVDMHISVLGMTLEARITGVTETYDANGASIELEIGEQLLTKTKKAVIQ